MKKITDFVCPLLSRVKDDGELIYVRCIGDDCISFRKGEFRDGCMIFSAECSKD